MPTPNDFEDEIEDSILDVVSDDDLSGDGEKEEPEEPEEEEDE